MLLLVCGALWLVSIALSHRYMKSIMTPIVAFYSAWLVSGIVNQVDLVNLYPIRFQEELILVGGLAAFFIGGLVAIVSFHKAVGQNLRSRCRYRCCTWLESEDSPICFIRLAGKSV